MLQKDSSHLHPGYYSSNPMTAITITITFTTAPADVLVILGHLQYLFRISIFMMTSSNENIFCFTDPL